MYNGVVATVTCDECGEPVAVTKSSVEEVPDWGEFAAECMSCGAVFKDVRREDDNGLVSPYWIAEDGRKLDEASYGDE